MDGNNDIEFSTQVHLFLDAVRIGKVNNQKKEILYSLVMQLEHQTEKQKRRFIMYYGLNKNNNALKFSEISKIEKCSSSAIRDSIITIRNKITKIKNEKRQILLEIMEE